jgi:hypothetical protein
VSSSAVIRWEYRVLNKQQVIDLGGKDLTAGLNKLGDDGWQLTAVDGAYIFKRPKDQARRQAELLQNQIALLDADVERLKDRVSWVGRMVKKGFLSTNQLEAERRWLQRAESALQQARRDLQSLTPDKKEPVEKDRKPEK